MKRWALVDVQEMGPTPCDRCKGRKQAYFRIPVEVNHQLVWWCSECLMSYIANNMDVTEMKRRMNRRWPFP